MPYYNDDYGYRSRSRTRYRRRKRAAYRSGGPARTSRQDSYDDGGPDFDGFYDRDGNRVRLTLAMQTPQDMLPPVRRAAERDDGNWPVARSAYRSRF